MMVRETSLPGVKLVEPMIFEDDRGFFMESYNRDVCRHHGIQVDFVQDNHSLSVKEGTIRGLHFQIGPKAQAKLVRVTTGSIFDVVVDVRQGSPTFGQWEGFTLSSTNKRQLFVPKGFAHGFCTLEPHTEVQYKVDEYYSPEHDRGIIWNDPTLAIHWPYEAPILSDKDRTHPLFRSVDVNFLYEEGDN
ncbi:dTDP-4-dehydrorhamnose 3,5-epimerase [Paenibacillus lycopersici]|uniref:dTDP-4-dehydrorhamnose 3,5-epimerase n=1 Tax=Paenibacillus lycopersici TaxID=2704462 RepID=A0A6C0FYH8_9BACL|nr:dTDP-4-dehydrorhamnose 3,5-epimerase [Paenibacillus lycopersici]QHT59270.1 dTDP-4-dehydrorhamnose 3,5-epimerase [Paenibacillus lycopersici]